MRGVEGVRSIAVLMVLGLLWTSFMACTQEKPEDSEPALQHSKIPISTASSEARELYLKGRDLNEKLRATDAHGYFQQAIAKDPDFGLAYVALAFTSPTASELFDGIKEAVERTGSVSEAERHWILGVDAGIRGLSEEQKNHFTWLVESYPDDERAHNLLAGYYFGRQEYDAAIKHYEQATKINPEFSQPYNQLGYAYRFLGRYDEAQKAFEKYIELIPDEPNPYDSYAELLMKRGRFEESIRNYEKALAMNANFMASYIGIGNNQIFMGQHDKARETFKTMGQVARTDGERRQALFWTAQSYIHEGRYDEAIAKIAEMAEIAAKTNDLSAMAGDKAVIGTILLHKGALQDASASYQASLDLSVRADTPEEVKEAARRNHLNNQARVALAAGDFSEALSKAQAYQERVEAKKIPNERRLVHELMGRIALEQNSYDEAVAELAQANQQDPQVHFLLAKAYQGLGLSAESMEACKRVTEFNGLNVNYGYVRADALKMCGGG